MTIRAYQGSNLVDMWEGTLDQIAPSGGRVIIRGGELHPDLEGKVLLVYDAEALSPKQLTPEGPSLHDRYLSNGTLYVDSGKIKTDPWLQDAVDGLKDYVHPTYANSECTTRRGFEAVISRHALRRS